MYNIPGKPSQFLELTGIIGKDGLVYWLAADVVAILHASKNFASRNTQLCVQDVTGHLLNVKLGFLRKRIFAHEKMLDLLKRSTCDIVQAFATYLNSSQTPIKIVIQQDVTKIQNPSRIMFLDQFMDETDQHFGVWFHFFKEEVKNNLYIIKTESAESENVVKIVTEYAETETEGPPFPKKIVYCYGGRSMTYTPNC